MATPPRSIPRQMKLATEFVPAPVESDELFPDDAPSAAETIQLARITCRVCSRAARVPIDHPALLCELCMEDLDKTRSYIASNIDSVITRLEALQSTWLATVAASPAAERWAKVQDAMIAVAEKKLDKATLDAQWAKRKAEGGPLATLLRAYESHDVATDQCGIDLKRWHQAQAEVNAVWLATEV